MKPFQTLTPPPPRGMPVLDGQVLSLPWSGWFTQLVQKLNASNVVSATGISTTITTAKLTGGGANGSMTFVNGILTHSTPAT